MIDGSFTIEDRDIYTAVCLLLWCFITILYFPSASRKCCHLERVGTSKLFIAYQTRWLPVCDGSLAHGLSAFSSPWRKEVEAFK